MAITTHLDIVSAEREIFSGIVEMVVATGKLGDLGIVPGHAPLLTSLNPGEIRITMPGGLQQIYYTTGGMLEVLPYYVTVLADIVEHAESLDEAKALEAKAKALEAISKHGSELDYSVATAELARAIAQIRIIRKTRSK